MKTCNRCFATAFVETHHFEPYDPSKSRHAWYGNHYHVDDADRVDVKTTCRGEFK